MRKLLVLLALLATASSASAQFIGYSSPQTIQKTIATNTPCTGGAQNFITGAVAGFDNLGQTQHYISIVPSAAVTSIQAEIDGIDRSGNVFRISDVLIATAATLPLATSGSGYYPQFQVKVTCGSAAGTFTLNYSGASSTFNQTVGSYLLGQIDKSLYAGAPANTNSQIQFQPPFASSGGTLLFTFNVGGPAGSSVQVQCAGNTIGISSQLFPLNTAASVQTLQVANNFCPTMQINYVSGGASAALYSMEYIFTIPGSPSLIQDPCQGAFVKLSAPISAGAAGTTKIITEVAGQTIYVCSYNASQVATAGTVRWISGTGATCGTATVNETGAMAVTASQPFTYAPGHTVFSSASGAAICMTTTGAGGTVDGVVTFVQQ